MVKANTTRPADIGQFLATRLRLGVEDPRVGIAGDSTGNEYAAGSEEWFEIYSQHVAAAHPERTVIARRWNDTTQSNNAAATIQTGTGPNGVRFRDTSTRTGDRYLSTPDLGAPWSGDGSAAAGDWTLDGTSAVRTAEATVAPVLASVVDPSDIQFDAEVVLPSESGLARSLRLIGQFKDSANNIFFDLAATSAGVPTAKLYKRIGNTATDVGSVASPFPATTDGNVLTVQIKKAGLTISATVNGKSVSATLTQAESDTMGGAYRVGITATPSAGIKLSDMTLTAATTPTKITYYNGSFPGSVLSYQQSRLALMFPGGLDLLFVSSSNNYGVGDVATYDAALRHFIAVRALFPSVAIVLSSQNPRKVPANA